MCRLRGVGVTGDEQRVLFIDGDAHLVRAEEVNSADGALTLIVAGEEPERIAVEVEERLRPGEEVELGGGIVDPVEEVERFVALHGVSL